VERYVMNCRLVQLIFLFCALATAPVSSATISANNSAPSHAFDKLILRSKETRSDVLVIFKGEKVLLENYFGHDPEKLYPLRSLTKSVVSLAVGTLVADGTFASVDVPVSAWIDQWKMDNRSKITLRHILNHTSGLDHAPGDRFLHSQIDSTNYVINLPLKDQPGARFSYNNEAVQVLSYVIKKASGRDIESLVSERIFRPLRIQRWKWERDLSGNAYTYTGLEMQPGDLLKIGQLMLHSGRWNGRPVIPKSWVELSTKPASNVASEYGLLWWIHREKGYSSCFYGSGWLGQTLITCPDTNSIGLRMRRGSDHPDESENREHGFLEFEELFSQALRKVKPR
jgi:CubicO group peptidase (beta-lactamase class C family)